MFLAVPEILAIEVMRFSEIAPNFTRFWSKFLGRKTLLQFLGLYYKIKHFRARSKVSRQLAKEAQKSHADKRQEAQLSL